MSLHFLPRFLSCAVLLGIVVPSTRADDTAAAIIHKAITAHGGTEALTKYQAGRQSAKGTLFISGLEIPFESTTVSKLPNQSKTVLSMDLMGRKVAIVQIYNDGKAKVQVDGMNREVDAGLLEEMKQGLLIQSVYRLQPLLEKTFQTRMMDGKTKIGNQDAHGIIVSGNGLKETKLFFSSETGLLLKMERRGLDESGKEGTLEILFDDYANVNNQKRPKKLTTFTGGRKMMELSVLEYTDLEKVDPREFDLGKE